MLRRSFKAPLSYMCYPTPSGCLSLARHIILAPQYPNAELTTDGTERQIIKDMEGNNQRPRIKYSSICDPFVFILREDDTIGLFIGEPERGKIRRKDMSPMGEKVGFSVLPFCGDINPYPKRPRAILRAHSLWIRPAYSKLVLTNTVLLRTEMHNLRLQPSNQL